jgi:outer membrane cobalamin receptor
MRSSTQRPRAPFTWWSLAVAANVLAVSAGAQASVPRSFIPLDSSIASAATAANLPPFSAAVTLTTETTRRDIIRAIAEQSGASVVFEATLPGLETVVRVQFAKVPASTALLRTLAGTEIRAYVAPSGTQIVLASTRRRATMRLDGSVRSSGGPVGGARIELLGTSLWATTHDDGSFTLRDVPSGDYEVRVRHLGYRPLLRQPLQVSPEGDATARFTLERDVVALEEMVVTPSYFGLLETRNAAQSMTREQLQTVPQIGEDIYRAINRLPGVAASDFSARFSVRGATADQLYVTLDGLRLIEPFHLKDIGSALSIIDIQTLGEASLSSGGSSAAYGDEIGGVFEMRSLDPRTERPRTALGLSLTNLRATSQGSFGGGRGGWLLSGRRGFLDLAFRLASLADSLSPGYDDVFGKLQYDLPRDGRVALHVLHSGDDLRYQDTGDSRIDSRYLSNYLWLTLDQPLGGRWHSATVLSAGALDWRRAGQSDTRVDASAAIEIEDARRLVGLELRQDWSFRASEWNLLSFGVDVRDERATYDYTQAWRSTVAAPTGPTTRVDFFSVFAQPRGRTIGSYVSDKVRLFDRLTLEGGLRSDVTSQASEHVLSPRAAAAWDIVSGTTMRASWGRYAQSQQLFALPVEEGVQTFEPADRSDQTEVGLEQALPRGIVARVNAYDRTLTWNRSRYVNASSAITPFPEVSYDRLRIPPGTGRARGVELAVSDGGGANVEWSASYALAEAVDHIAGRDVPRATDQRHTAHVDWSWHPASNAWRLAIAGTWHTGTPDTPDIVLIDTLVNTPTQLTISSKWKPGLLYSERVPDYRRLDVRWTRFITTSRGRASLFVELYNALGAENVRGYYTNVGITGHTVQLVRGTRTQLPRIPSAGFTWEF